MDYVVIQKVIKGNEVADAEDGLAVEGQVFPRHGAGVAARLAYGLGRGNECVFNLPGCIV